MFKTTNRKKWSEIREKGKWNYILNYGVLRFGISTWTIMMVYFWVFQPIEERLIFTVVSLITFPLAGLAWGRWMWFYLEKLYSKLPDSNEDQK
ncbi:MAG: hypothetical protein HN995_10205 [Candidatus Marinimicrobia bacterium]|jgi:hypothetical protein|nr:hypothetical protein [Candidatus Neomarinimicrobiota bacterium]MBT3577068.1 hypothetical protein [Candidatus Neomarinimicrobiota bacterium]MBT3679950.1 hypothetical protein [Candidatus Neomarinimicrobiota bacterium]MBT3949655.1 hypothetical protein [Candidatus Neomarinimicrobiota bacterium]MBT4253194.1 hypothetical protein [Candidatus Neomarinimicrobiota bacterium]